MCTQLNTRRKRDVGPISRVWRIALVGGSCVLAVASIGAAQSSGGPDPVDRSMQFVQRSMAATDLLNEGKPAEALPILQELAGQAELDEDGYATLTLGDCLSMLHRPDEARRAFLTAAAAHPERKAEIDQRLLDLELSGAISDDIILRLRAAAATSDDSHYLGAWNLGRALQKKAKALLDEAMVAFSRACETESPIGEDLCQTSHRNTLADLDQQLGAFISQAENRWQRLRQASPATGEEKNAADAPSASIASCQADWSIRQADGRVLDFQLRQDKPDTQPRITVKLKPVELTRDQAAMIRKHQEQIAHILSEAAGKLESVERR